MYPPPVERRRTPLGRGFANLCTSTAGGDVFLAPRHPIGLGVKLLSWFRVSILNPVKVAFRIVQFSHECDFNLFFANGAQFLDFSTRQPFFRGPEKGSRQVAVCEGQSSGSASERTCVCVCVRVKIRSSPLGFPLASRKGEPQETRPQGHLARLFLARLH